MSLLCWLLCMIAMIIGYLLVPNMELLCALLVFAAAPMVSWLIMILIRKKIRIQLMVPGVTEKRKSFVLSARMQSNTGIPLGKTVVWLQLTNTVTEEIQRKRVCFRGDGQWHLESIYCGCIECLVISVWCYDIFGILPMRIPCKAKKRTVVMPDTFPVEIENILSRSDTEDCVEYAPDKKGSDPTETLQIRDYLPGDSLRQIHWKMSSKLDKLIVREPSEPINRELMVFLDRSSDVVDPGTADALMEAVTSVCQGLTEMGQPFCLAWNEENICVYEVNHQEQLPEAIAAMLKSRRPEDGMSGSALYRKMRGDVKAGAVLYFCSRLPDDSFPAEKVQTYLCGQGENIMTFTPKNMSNTLRKISWS